MSKRYVLKKGTIFKDTHTNTKLSYGKVCKLLNEYYEQYNNLLKLTSIVEENSPISYKKDLYEENKLRKKQVQELENKIIRLKNRIKVLEK